MGALIDLTGRTFGMLTVKTRLADKVTPSGARQPVWGCVCACGRRSAEEGRALRARRAITCRRCVRDPTRTLRYGRVYLMYFPEHRVLKIGFHTSSTRLRELLAAGGVHIEEFRDVDKSWEAAGRRALDRIFDPAFTSRADATHVIPRGAGWTDCYTVDPEDLILARHEVFEAAMKEGNDFGENPPATAPWLRALRRIQQARRVARASDADAIGAERVDRVAAEDPAGPGVDCQATARRVAGRVGDRPNRARRARAGRRRARRHVVAGRPRMARPAPQWARRSTPCLGGARSVFAALLDSTHFHRLRRERKRERTHERASTRASTCTCGSRATGVRRTLGAGAPTACAAPETTASTDLGCSTTRLPGPPERDDRRRMRALRYSGRYPQDLAEAAAVHGRAHAIRASAGAGAVAEWSPR